MKLILTHENADFDAVASMLGASKLYPNATPLLPRKLQHGVKEFLQLYQGALPFISQKNWNRNNLTVEHIILTDTQSYQSIKGVAQDTPVLIIDHHPLERELKSYETWAGDTIGSASTIVIEHIQEQDISLTSLEATLLALGIYADTGMLTYSRTTHRDVTAVAWLLQQGVVLDTVRDYLILPLTDTQQTLFNKLLQSDNHRTIHGQMITIASTSTEEYIDGIASVTQRLMDIWDSSAIFTVVEMPQKTQLVCRSQVNDIDVSDIAQLFGGGGHPRASAASIKDMSLGTIVDKIWQHLYKSVHPAIRVADLMSYGLQNLQADDKLDDKLSFIRRVGHEGYPVVDDNQIVGLLTRRDADRAIEYNLKSVKVRDVMMEGNVTLSPDDSIAYLEELIVNSGWGQIPVVNEVGEPIGIVTRTDLIKHWADAHPKIEAQQHITVVMVQSTLGHSVANLISVIAETAQQNNTPIYIVGGVVRDLLLQRKNLDIDIVVEDDAIEFTEHLVQKFGGTLHSHKPFGTAKWLISEDVAERLKLNLDNIPKHIDFATSRFEYYEQPTALPTVYSSSIKLDLQRRDFTINTIAIQLSPSPQIWRILDLYGGLNDLKAGIIRVLHSLSFIDDPTRILRAVRFSERLGFEIESRTADLIHTALPMLERITGERIRNEITLLLNEDEPENGLLVLQKMGVLEAIDPNFFVSANLANKFQIAREKDIPWETEQRDISELYWHIMMIDISPKSVKQICSRLSLGRAITQSITATTTLIQNMEHITREHTKPSEITTYLETMPPIALQVAWLISADKRTRTIISQFITVWQHTQANINGHDLQQMGIPPGPKYKTILDSLRFAWLDGEITSEEEEQAYLKQLISQEE